MSTSDRAAPGRSPTSPGAVLDVGVGRCLEEQHQAEREEEPADRVVAAGQRRPPRRPPGSPTARGRQRPDAARPRPFVGATRCPSRWSQPQRGRDRGDHQHADGADQQPAGARGHGPMLAAKSGFGVRADPDRGPGPAPTRRHAPTAERGAMTTLAPAPTHCHDRLRGPAAPHPRRPRRSASSSVFAALADSPAPTTTPTPRSPTIKAASTRATAVIAWTSYAGIFTCALARLLRRRASGPPSRAGTRPWTADVVDARLRRHRA